MRLRARRCATRRISWIDQRMKWSGVFFGYRLISQVLDRRYHGEAKHDERDVTMPAMPGSGLVVVETELVLGSLEAVLDRPAMAFDADQRVDRSPSWAPCGEVREISVCDVAPDQQATCPQAMVFLVELSRAEISQFQVAPVMQPWSFRARP